MTQPKQSGNGRWKIWTGVSLVTIGGFVAAWFLMEPAPPNHLVIATGRADGAYHAFGEKYAAILAEQGITLVVRETAGSIENYELLRDDPGVHLAIVQGGTASKEVLADDDVETLTGLYLEPVWVFVRADEESTPSDLRELRGRRIAIGGEGSGTRAVAEELLAINGVSGGEDGTTLLPVSGADAAGQLEAGEIDAAFFVISTTSPLVSQLLEADGVKPLGISRNEAYRRRLPYLSAVTLPEGVVDFERNLPRANVPMVAPVAQLVANERLHDAFVPLLLDAVKEVNGPGDLLTEPGEFPSATRSEFPVNTAARQWFASGPSFLYRVLPFWVASAIDRGKILLLPALTLLLPLVKVFPPVIRWRIRSSIYRWYEDLREVDQSLREKPNATRTRAMLDRVARMQQELDAVNVPLSYMEEFYNLRLHIDLVRRTLLERLEELGEETPGTKPSDENGDDTSTRVA